MEKTEKKFRARKLNEKFIQMFEDEKQLKPLLDLVLREKSYDLELRGNYVVIYYRGGALFTIRYKKDGYSIKFNEKYFNEERLKKEKFYNPKIKEFMNNSPDTITCQYAIENIFYFKYIMDCYFAYNPKMERQVQQDCVRANNRDSKISEATDYYVLDIEYKTEDTGARFDMLMVEWPSISARRKNRENLGLIFVELKYGDGAITGKSGIEKHIIDYLDVVADQTLIEQLCDDMEKVYAQKKRLGLIPGEHGNKNTISIDRKNIKMIFGFMEHDPNKTAVVEELAKCLQKYEHTESIYVASGTGCGFFAYKRDKQENVEKFTYPTIKEFVEQNMLESLE